MSDYHLLTPRDSNDWAAYHEIRRRVLFEARGQFGVYDPDRPDETAPGNHPMLLIWRGAVVGVVRIDVRGATAVVRRVAIREDSQRRGHGSALIRLVEQFAREQGCRELASHVAPDAVEFYRKSGFSVAAEESAGKAVFMMKIVQVAP